jgi:solute carrier family 8 (sodium/calcium exchanger)
VKNLHPLIGFKCLHYSVVESSGQVELTVLKKEKGCSFTFGVRTLKDTATPGSDYKDIDETHTIKPNEEQLIVNVPIIDNNEWEPDLDFFVEIYDTSSGKRFSGDDTLTRVTILDEDFPGILSFEATSLSASKDQEYLDIVILRQKGSDGKVTCTVKTEPLVKGEESYQNAKENIDYSPLDTYVEFKNGEM